MLSPAYISFHHARALTRSGAKSSEHHNLVPQTTSTIGLSGEIPEAYVPITTTYEVPTGTFHVFSTRGKDLSQLAFVIWGSANTRVSSLSISDRTYVYQALFKPEQSQLLAGALLWGRENERASAPQEWVTKFPGPSPVLKAHVVEKFNQLVTEWRKTRNPVGSVLEISSNFAYQKIIGMGQDAIPLILRELERSIDHWFWALSAITGENPVAEDHRGRLKPMAQDWFSWAKQQGYQW